jgi:hypothetical protein
MAKVIAMNIKKVFFIILIVAVSILVFFAFYSSRDKFGGIDTMKYMKIQLNNATSIHELAEKYSDSKTKDKFVSELKKVNEISSSDYIDRKTVFIPVFKSN